MNESWKKVLVVLVGLAMFLVIYIAAAKIKGEREGRVSVLKKEVADLKSALEEATKSPENKVSLNFGLSGTHKSEYKLDDKAGLALLRLLVDLNKEKESGGSETFPEKKTEKEEGPKAEFFRRESSIRSDN